VKSDLGEATPERGGKAKRTFESTAKVYGKCVQRRDADEHVAKCPEVGGMA